MVASHKVSVRPLISPHDQGATFVELFFDLVFVFGITQVTVLIHHGLAWPGLAQRGSDAIFHAISPHS